jgi:hypothetical protein
VEAQRNLVIADRSGGREFLKVAPANVSEPRPARDGRTIAFVRTENGEANIRFVDFSPLVLRPFDQMPDGKMLAWTPDARPDTSASAPGAPAATKPSEIRIVLNWIEELEAKVR